MTTMSALLQGKETHHFITTKPQGKKLNNLIKGLNVRCTGASSS